MKNGTKYSKSNHGFGIHQRVIFSGCIDCREIIPGFSSPYMPQLSVFMNLSNWTERYHSGCFCMNNHHNVLTTNSCKFHVYYEVFTLISMLIEPCIDANANTRQMSASGLRMSWYRWWRFFSETSTPAAIFQFTFDKLIWANIQSFTICIFKCGFRKLWFQMISAYWSGS